MTSPEQPTPAEVEPKPCPRCTAQPVVVGHGKAWGVRCSRGDHLLWVYGGSKAEAVEAWNARPQPTDDAAGLVKRLREGVLWLDTQRSSIVNEAGTDATMAEAADEIEGLRSDITDLVAANGALATENEELRATFPQDYQNTLDAVNDKLAKAEATIEKDRVERKQMWADIRAVQPDPAMRRLSPEVIDQLDEEAEAAFALADDGADRRTAIAMGMLVEWQRNPGPKTDAAEAKVATLTGAAGRGEGGAVASRCAFFCHLTADHMSPAGEATHLCAGRVDSVAP